MSAKAPTSVEAGSILYFALAKVLMHAAKGNIVAAGPGAQYHLEGLRKKFMESAGFDDSQLSAYLETLDPEKQERDLMRSSKADMPRAFEGAR